MVFSGLLADAHRILGLAREPAAEAVVGFQITDLPLVGHGILQDADQAHSDRWPRVIGGKTFVPTVPAVQLLVLSSNRLTECK